VVVVDMVASSRVSLVDIPANQGCLGSLGVASVLAGTVASVFNGSPVASRGTPRYFVPCRESGRSRAIAPWRTYMVGPIDPAEAVALSSPTRESVLDEQRLRRLLEVGRALVAELDIERLLQRVLAVAQELTRARYAALGVLDERREHLERFLTLGIDAETHRAIGDLPRGHGLLGVLISDPRPLRLRDVGEHPHSYGFPTGHPPMRSFLGAPILIRGEAFGNVYLTDKESGDFDEADEEALIILADWAAIAIENARLYSAVRARRDELERAVSALETTTAIARAVGGETDLQRILELIAKRGRALVEARAIVIELVDGPDLVIQALAGDAGADLLGLRIPVEGSLGGHVLRTRRGERLADAPSRLRFQLAESMGAKTGLLVPLVFRNQAVGVAAAFDRRVDGPEFSLEDERLMEAFAASAATAVATAQTVEAKGLERAVEASEIERRRWARELHDDSLQELAAVRLRLGALAYTPPADIAAAVARAVEHVDASIHAMRSLITDMRPAALDQLGVAPALETLVERVAATSGLDVELHADLRFEAGDEEQRLAPVVETTVYRVVQEALTNVAKHADASRATVTVVDRDGTIEIAVTDDGRGFREGDATDGFGLIGMGERVRLAGGRHDIESAPGQGTTVHASIPAARRDTGRGPRAAVA
jgi:signal transduction histidine kinase